MEPCYYDIVLLLSYYKWSPGQSMVLLCMVPPPGSGAGVRVVRVLKSQGSDGRVSLQDLS
jgi:hypothetical protein